MRSNRNILLLAALACSIPGLSAQDQTKHSANSGSGETSQSAVLQFQRVRFSEQIAGAQLTREVRPEYPLIALQAHITGTVVLSVIIGTDGAVTKVDLVSGPPMLNRSAIEAVRKWRYKPMLVDGKAVEVETTVTVEYSSKGVQRYEPPPAPTPRNSPAIVSDASAADVNQQFPQPGPGSEWHTVTLESRPLNIAASRDVLWVCGADELVANSTDGGKTWSTQHVLKGGGLFLTIGVAGDSFVYAAGTGGDLLISKDAGSTWTRIAVPAAVVYAASFSDQMHGLIHTPHTIYRTADGGVSWLPVPINISSGDLDGFPYVRGVVALDADHMIVLMSEGKSSIEEPRPLVTKDGGRTWKPVIVPSTGISSLSAYNGEYWAAGMEVIEKDKPGGGYGVPLVMHSPDGEAWTHITKWGPREFSECNAQTCLFSNGAGVDFRATSPQNPWVFLPSPTAMASEWGVAHGSICSVGIELNCAALTPVSAIPAKGGGSPIPLLSAPPPLNAPDAQGIQCISCEIDRTVRSDGYLGPVDLDLKLYIGQNGLVGRVEVVRATNSEIGDRIASRLRTWIFVPYEKDGVTHPVVTDLNLRVLAISN